MDAKSRNTRQKETLKETLEKFDSFFTAEEFFKKAKKKEPNLGIATVYRFLNLLATKKEIHSYICNKRKLYSREKNSHCHYICEKTGKTIHFDIDNLDFLKNLKTKIPGTINSVQLEIKGICKGCNH